MIIMLGRKHVADLLTKIYRRILIICESKGCEMPNNLKKIIAGFLPITGENFP